MHQLKSKAREFGRLIQRRCLLSPVKSPSECSAAHGLSSSVMGRFETSKTILLKPDPVSCYSAYISRTIKDLKRGEGISIVSGEQCRSYMISRKASNQFNKHKGKHIVAPYLVRISAPNYSTESSKGAPKEETRKDVSTLDDPFDAPTYNIPEKPMTFTEGASYSVIILAGLGIAALAAYSVFKELIFEPKEYKIFGKALERVQHDNQVTVRVGSPVTGYGSESRNRAARQRIPNRVWTDEDGVEHVEVNFYIRGPHGAGKVYTEMFKDHADKKWKFTYLIVEVTSPHPAQLMLESYVPA